MPGAPSNRQQLEPGPDPERASYGSFFYFTDPDGNTWITQEVTTRRPGRIDAGETGYVSAADLEAALRRAEVAHRERAGQDGDWAAWYASYMVAEQAGTDLP